MTKIGFIPKGINSSIVCPHIEFESGYGPDDAVLYIDHIRVAIFCTTTGGLYLLPMQIGPYRVDDSDKVKYLEDRGFQLTKVDKKEGYYNYYISVEQG